MKEELPKKGKKTTYVELNEGNQQSQSLSYQSPESINIENFNIKETLSRFFLQDNIRDNISLKNLHSISGITNLAAKLDTNLSSGLVTTDVVANQIRRANYGRNDPIRPPWKSIWDLIKEQFEDFMLRILTVAAIFSLIVGVIKEGIKTGWMEGFTIFLAVIIIVSVSAGNNYLKEKQFQALNRKKEERNVKVF